MATDEDAERLRLQTSFTHSNARSALCDFSMIDPVVHGHGAMNQHMPGPYADSIRTSMSPPVPRQSFSRSRESFRSNHLSILGSASPRTPSSTRGSSCSLNMVPTTAQHLPSSYNSPQRSLPQKTVSEATIADAYIAFILYCNPGIPAAADTSELLKCFRTPPKSEGKTFSTYRLWELIQQFDSGELKTWAQLVVELGVQPPLAAKNQSSQKLQQYAVRLKRWMHAMHIDAFFEYTLNRPHEYYLNPFPPHGSQSDQPRDGVAPEEDLALRALLPQWRPKRGRRKLGSIESEEDVKSQAPQKRPRLDRSATDAEYEEYHNQHSGLLPESAMPWSAMSYETPSDPWRAHASMTAASLDSGQRWTSSASNLHDDFRWSFQNRMSSPFSNQPQSALIARPYSPQFSHQDEPRSAVEPIRKTHGHRKRKHIVSSAWLKSSSMTKNPGRGRPSGKRPSVESVLSASSVMAVEPREANSSLPKVQSPRSVDQFLSNGTSGNEAPEENEFQVKSRPTRLHLQVPARTGGPIIRITTPPGTLAVDPRIELQSFAGDDCVNAETNQTNPGESSATDDEVDNTHLAMPFTLDEIERVFAGRLVGEKVINNSKVLSLDEAKQISSFVIKELRMQRQEIRNWDLIAYATLLGVAHNVGGKTSSVMEAIEVTEDASTSCDAMTNDTAGRCRRQFRLDWTIRLGAISAKCQMEHVDIERLDANGNGTQKHQQMTLPSKLPYDQCNGGRKGSTADECLWKEKYMTLQNSMLDQQKELAELRRKI